eukprot:764874-Hanusia_phi.AAC.3
MKNSLCCVVAQEHRLQQASKGVKCLAHFSHNACKSLVVFGPDLVARRTCTLEDLSFYFPPPTPSRG